MNYYERDDDESAIEGKKKICRELFGDSDLSDDGEFYNYDQDDFKNVEYGNVDRSVMNFKKDVY